MPSLLSRLRSRIARPYVREMRAALASMARTLKAADAEIETLQAEARSYRGTLARYSNHLDDIRCELADAGIPIPADDDPETTPRRMVRVALDRLAALTPVVKPVRPVSEARRTAILRSVNAYMTDDPADADPPTAYEVAEDLYAGGDEAAPFHGVTISSIERHVSRVAAEGWIASDGHKPARYALTAMGIEALAGERAEGAA